jgi:hypothetical protein
VAVNKQAQYANTKRRDVQFAVGDWVLLSLKDLRFKQGSPKLLPRWVGPFQIAKRIGNLVYELMQPARWKIHDVFHIFKLDATAGMVRCSRHHLLRSSRVRKNMRWTPFWITATSIHVGLPSMNISSSGQDTLRKTILGNHDRI